MALAPPPWMCKVRCWHWLLGNEIPTAPFQDAFTMHGMVYDADYSFRVLKHKPQSLNPQSPPMIFLVHVVYVVIYDSG
jgi:hypothetical protein